MRNLGSIVHPALGHMWDRRKQLSVSDPVASEFVSDQAIRFPTLTLQELTKEALSGTAVPARLDQDVDSVSVLIYRSP